MTVEIKITHRSNAVTVIPLAFVDASGNAIDWTGNTFEMDISTAAGATPALTLTSGSGIVATDLANSTIAISIAADSIEPGSYVYDLLMVSGGVPQTICFGAITVIDGVTEL